ncbi:MAG: diaminopimelate epimerase, partial [Micrococcales bacterium]|nr:diaminopimelate epimerase [Micrococcales bacterium]
MPTQLSGLAEGLLFTKGQGTGNDFVLFADPEGRVDFTPEMASSLADRHFGIGADGVIRAVLNAAVPEGQAILEKEPSAVWFMDIRNADGSGAEMCGNGARVFAAYLAHRGLVDLPDDGSLAIGTRAGVVWVHREDQGFAVDMGTWSFPGGQTAVRAGSDTQVQAVGLDRVLPGLSVNLGNPHVVAKVSATELAGLDLTQAPELDPAPPHGANTEFVAVAPVSFGDTCGTIDMRVYERGVGETLSCGTGACAAALAASAWA